VDDAEEKEIALALQGMALKVEGMVADIGVPALLSIRCRD
jgi:hypothetical protein